MNQSQNADFGVSRVVSAVLMSFLRRQESNLYSFFRSHAFHASMGRKAQRDVSARSLSRIHADANKCLTQQIAACETRGLGLACCDRLNMGNAKGGTSIRGMVLMETLLALVLISLMVGFSIQVKALSDGLWVKGTQLQVYAGLNQAREHAKLHHESVVYQENKARYFRIEGTPSHLNEPLQGGDLSLYGTQKIGFTATGTTRFANTLTIQKGAATRKISLGVGLGKVAL